jgi:hypothetical protein
MLSKLTGSPGLKLLAAFIAKYERYKTTRSLKSAQIFIISFIVEVAGNQTLRPV